MKITIIPTLTEKIEASAQIQVGEGEKKPFCLSCSPIKERELYLKTPEELAASLGKAELTDRVYVFDSDKLEEAVKQAYLLYDSCNPDRELAVIKKFPKDVDGVTYRKHLVFIKELDDDISFVHEMFHISENLFYKSQQDQIDKDNIESAINLAAAFLVKEFPDIVEKLKAISIESMIDEIKKIHPSIIDNPGELGAMGRVHDVYRISMIYTDKDIKINFEDLLLNFYFYHELKGVLRERKIKKKNKGL